MVRIGIPVVAAISRLLLPALKSRETAFCSSLDLRTLFRTGRTYVRILSTGSMAACPWKRLRMDRRGRDGIGRRARFRSWWASARGGSSPSARTVRPRQPPLVTIRIPLGQWPNWLRHRSPKPAIPGSSPGCPVSTLGSGSLYSRSPGGIAADLPRICREVNEGQRRAERGCFRPLAFPWAFPRGGAPVRESRDCVFPPENSAAGPRVRRGHGGSPGLGDALDAWRA